MESLSANDVLKIFKLYIGLKLHFNSDKFVYYDNFRHNSFDEHSMDKRRDVDMFIEVADKYGSNINELKSILISLFKSNPDTWIGAVLDKTNDGLHTKRIANILNLTHVIEKNVSQVKDYLIVNKCSLADVLSTNNDRPAIVKRLRLSDEFLALLDFSHPYLLQETDNPLWKKRSFLLHKYKYLIDTNDNILSSIESLS